MADPFKEARFTILVTMKTSGAFKVLVGEKAALRLMKAWEAISSTAVDTWYVEHSEGVLQVDLANIEAINTLVPEHARREVLEILSV